MTKVQDELRRLEARIPSGRHWYLVMTQPGKENFAARNLEAQAFEVFLPQIVKRTRHGRVVKERLGPFFPRYLFVTLDLWEDHWRSILGTFGVSSLFMIGSHPQPAPKSVIDALLAARDGQGQIDLKSDLCEGDLVRFKTGPFANLVGQLAAMNGSDRVAVLLDIMGTIRSVQVSKSDLLPIRTSGSTDTVQAL